MLKEIAQFIANIAPTIGTALGLKGVGNLAKDVITEIFNLPKEASDNDIESAISKATPKQLIQLRKQEQDFKVLMKQMNIDVFKLKADLEKERMKQEVADRESARDMAKNSSTKIKMPIVLTFINMFMMCVIVTAFVVLELKHINSTALEEVLTIVLTLQVREQIAIFAFYFGGSYDSRVKDEMINNSVSKDSLQQTLDFSNKDKLKSDYVTRKV